MKVESRVSKGDLLGTVTEIDEAGTLRVKWDLESEGATWEQESELTEVLVESVPEVVEAPLVEVAEQKPKKEKKAKKEKTELSSLGPISDAINPPADSDKPADEPIEPVAVVLGGKVKITGRIKTKAQKDFVVLIGSGSATQAEVADFTPEDERTLVANHNLTKTEFKVWKKEAKRAGLVLEVVEVKEPTKRLSPKERARQKDIQARRLAQLAEARKNLAAKRALDGTSSKPKEKEEVKEEVKEEPAVEANAA